MIVVDSVTPVQNGEMHVPIYHRGHLSLRSGTAVTVCLLPPTKQTIVPGMHELVVSPIAFPSWQNLISINATIRPTAGTLTHLAEAIRSECLDVLLYEQSALTEDERGHQFEALADANFLYAQPLAKDQRASDPLAVLERRLRTLCLDELVFLSGQPQLHVRPVQGLQNAWRDAARISSSHRGESWPRPVRSVVQRGILRLPDTIRAALGSSPVAVVQLSDTRDRMLRILVPDSQTQFTHVRVGPSSFRVERDSHNDLWWSGPVGMWAGCI